MAFVSRLGVLLLVVLISTAVTAPYAIKQTCASDEQELFSLSSTTNGNAGAPGRHPWKLCSTGELLTLSETCPSGEISIGGLTDPNGAGGHIFIEDTPGTQKICAQSLYWYASETCPGATEAAFSVHSSVGGHVASPGVFPYDVCITEVNNWTMALTAENQGTVSIGTATYIGSNELLLPDTPFISREFDNHTLFGLVSTKTPKAIRYVNNSALELRIVSARPDKSFILPITLGTRWLIEQRKGAILSNSFLTQRRASFVDRPLGAFQIRMSAKYNDVDFISDARWGRGAITLQIRNAGVGADGRTRVVVTRK